MNLYEKIVNREEKIALVGLGYVGMPLLKRLTLSALTSMRRKSSFTNRA